MRTVAVSDQGCGQFLAEVGTLGSAIEVGSGAASRIILGEKFPRSLRLPRESIYAEGMADPSSSVARPKMNPLVRVVVMICAFVAIVGGIMQMTRGFRDMKGDPEVGRLSQESDTAFNQANQFLGEAAPLFQAMLNAVDQDGLAAVRTGKKDEAAKAATLFEQAAEQLRLAAQKAMDAAARKPPGNAVAFLETKAEAYRNFAAARDLNRDIARMVLDESIKTGEELVPKILEAAGRRDKLEEAAKAAVVRADQLVAESKK